MTRRLLVPLDGSELAEVAVPVAVTLARCLPGSIYLLHVHEKDAPSQVHQQPHLKDPQEARIYLESLRQRLVPADIEVECSVRVGQLRRDVAKSIVATVEEVGAYMVVMCTHGWGGLRDVLFGTIAQQVISHGSTPVLVVRPTGGERAFEFRLRRILIPLDGKPSHEAGLRIAQELAHPCGAELLLITVIPRVQDLSGEEAITRVMLPSAAEAVLELAEQGAVQYLSGLVSGLRTLGLAASASVLRGAVDSVIVSTARQQAADVIVLATHRRAGFEAFWAGSMAPKVASQCDLPLLLVPVVQ